MDMHKAFAPFLLRPTTIIIIIIIIDKVESRVYTEVTGNSINRRRIL